MLIKYILPGHVSGNSDSVSVGPMNLFLIKLVDSDPRRSIRWGVGMGLGF